MRWGCQRNNQRSPKTLLFVFKINVQNPPRSKQWGCSISFDGKSTAEFNAVKCTEPEELDRDELIARRTELLENGYKKYTSCEGVPGMI